MVHRLPFAIVLLFLVVGCSPPYTENEILNYFDDAAGPLHAHRAILNSSQQRFATLAEVNAASDEVDSLEEAFKRRYQGTPLDKEFKLLEDRYLLSANGLIYMNACVDFSRLGGDPPDQKLC